MVRVDADPVSGSPARRTAVDFDLQGSDQAGELRLFTPLGSTAARITWHAQGAMLDDTRTQRGYASLPDLLQDVLGTELPVAALFDWLRGRAHEVPGWQVDMTQQAQGRLQAQRQTPAPAVQIRMTLDSVTDSSAP
ncbi:MAG: hypothetical protein OHK0048_11000 [Rhodoferax sp.]